MSLDFVDKHTKISNKEKMIGPNFRVCKTRDLMIKGRDFYAIWDEENGMWSTDFHRAVELIDKEIDAFKKQSEDADGIRTTPLYLKDSVSGSVDLFCKYCTKQCPDSYHQLDQKVVFSNDVVSRNDYCSFKLPYALVEGDCSNWDNLLDVLYSPSEQAKIRWLIGSLVNGDSKKWQKFFVFYGDPGSGKSTIINIINDMFKGYDCVFNAHNLGSSTDAFAIEPFKNFPLIAIEHDSDLSKIESNARLNSLVSHEALTINEKHKSLYSAKFHTYLIIGTNKPVRITDAKSGLLRRLIDIHPSGRKLSLDEYNRIMDAIRFEYGAIAYSCKQFYIANKNMFKDYVPTEMIGETNDIFNFFEDKAISYSSKHDITLNEMWKDFLAYCEESKVAYPPTRRIFKQEAKAYFKEFKEVARIENGSTPTRNVYYGFKMDKFFWYLPKEDIESVDAAAEKNNGWIILKESDGVNKFNQWAADCPAQYEVEDPATNGKRPERKWDNCTSKLQDIDTSKVHYVKVPENLIVLDFDIKGDDGEKSLEKNLEKASKYPETYAEVSKSGGGLHLHYIYTGGDVDRLARIIDDNVELKVFTGGSALRRRLSLCNDLEIATINSGLPFKEEKKKVIDEFVLKSEKALRSSIMRNLRKEIAGSTAVSVNFIFNDLQKAYDSGLKYDVTDMRPSIMAFAAQSTHQSERCLSLVNKMQFKGKEEDPEITKSVYESHVSDEDIRYGEFKDLLDSDSDGFVGFKGNKDSGEMSLDDFSDFIFYDVEVFPNLFVVVWKKYGDDEKCVTWINPTPSQIEKLCKAGKIVGFNNRQYDNHILWARMLGYSEIELYRLSQRLVASDKGDKNAYFREAYTLSYTDIYDYCSAGNKMSLKKWEIKLGIHHLELGLPWDQEVDKSLWDKVAEYCCNDVISTEATFKATLSDYTARVILADVAGGTPNDTTNQLTAKLIFGKETHPQREFKYRDLSKPVKDLDEDMVTFLKEVKPDLLKETFGDENSLLPYFKGYKYENGKSIYKDVEVGEGGRVCAEWGVWHNVALIDIQAQHPNSLISECLFGPKFTRVFSELVQARAYIKHKEWDKLKVAMNGRIAKYVDLITSGKIKGKDLSNALKTAQNSVYGLTSAKFPNKFKDDRNIDNIVAKRGALFMIDLAEEVEKRGFKVAHIKTDSIKIPEATPEIVNFVLEYGKRHGYTFEFEALYSTMCLINNAVYIARYATPEQCEKLHKFVPGDNADHGGQWTATGAQFAEPYVFKNLFTHEEITMEDLSVTKSVKTYMVIDENEELKEGEHNYRFIGKVSAFCPVVDGVGGGPLYRVTEKKAKDNPDVTEFKYDAVAGTKGYKWLEYEHVCDKGVDVINKRYFKELAQASIDDIEKYEPFDKFVEES